MKRGVIYGSLIVGAVIIGVIVLMAFSSLLGKLEEADRQNQIYEEKVNTQKMIDTCMDSAYETYVKDWNKQCEIENKQKDCLLTNFQAQQFDEQYEKAQELCVTRYK